MKWHKCALAVFCLMFCKITYAAGELPEKYIPDENGYELSVMNQGAEQSCWAYVCAEALEAATGSHFSIEHIKENVLKNRENSAKAGFYDAMSYLLSWQGPLTTDASKHASDYHVQEVLFPDTTEKIKKCIMDYKAVQTSMHSEIKSGISTEYYNENNHAYYYSGAGTYNHEVLIIGWDDAYPAENFSKRPSGNGAYLCLNSAGEDFGENGSFWVSYYDTAIGKENMVFSRVCSDDNYDDIYQCDWNGYQGQLENETGALYTAAVYTARKDTCLAAVGFYVFESDISYEIYTGSAEDGIDITDCRVNAEKSFDMPGYYTVSLKEPLKLRKNDDFFVMVYCGEGTKTAVSFDNDGIADGDSYISSDGKDFQNVQENLDCSLCIKAYTCDNNGEK